MSSSRDDPHIKFTTRPHCIVGAQSLSSAVWRVGDEVNGYRYCFSVFRMNPETGRVGQSFRAKDVFSFVKLAHVLAITLVDDGGLNAGMSSRLQQLIGRLDTALVDRPDGEEHADLATITSDVIDAMRRVITRVGVDTGAESDDTGESVPLYADLAAIDAWLQTVEQEDITAS